jgi:hypothetical protein
MYGPAATRGRYTVTPTYHYKIFFARAEFSYVRANHTTAGLAFGPSGTNTTQARGVIAAGIIF